MLASKGECPPSSGRDLRYAPMLSHPAASAAARSFSDLQDVADAFEARRSALTRLQQSCSIQRQRQCQQKQQQQKQTQQQLHTHHEFVAGEFSFAAGLLSIADPSTPLLSPSDTVRCLQAFVERAANNLAGNANMVAASYTQASSPSKLRATCLADTLDVLQRPLRAISDAGLSNAFVHHLSKVLRTTIVVRRGGAGSSCQVFPPDAAGSTPCALFGRLEDASGFTVVQCGPTLREVQVWLAADVAPSLAPGWVTGTAGGRAALEEVSRVASTLGIATIAENGKPKSKAALAGEIAEVASAGMRAPRAFPLSAFVTL